MGLIGKTPGWWLLKSELSLARQEGTSGLAQVSSFILEPKESVLH